MARSVSRMAAVNKAVWHDGRLLWRGTLSVWPGAIHHVNELLAANIAASATADETEDAADVICASVNRRHQHVNFSPELWQRWIRNEAVAMLEVPDVMDQRPISYAKGWASKADVVLD